jgi:hypothetical protein
LNPAPETVTAHVALAVKIPSLTWTTIFPEVPAAALVTVTSPVLLLIVIPGRVVVRL